MAIKILCSVKDIVRDEFHPPLLCNNRLEVYRSFIQAMEQVPPQARSQYHLYLNGHFFTSSGKLLSQEPLFIVDGSRVHALFDEYIAKLSSTGPDPMITSEVQHSEVFRQLYFEDVKLLDVSSKPDNMGS